MNPNPIRAAVLAGALFGCTLDGLQEERACTLDLRVNYCVTLNGGAPIPEDVRILRVRESHTDTLSGPWRAPQEASVNRACFHESRQPATLRVLRGDTLLKELRVGPIPSEDGCHHADTTIDITY